MTNEGSFLLLLIVGVGALFAKNFYSSLGSIDSALFLVTTGSLTVTVATLAWDHYSKFGKDRRNRLETIRNLPKCLILKNKTSIELGTDLDLKVPIFLSDSIRSRHVHILGATGSGKTESVILNFIRQDVKRGLGAIILDAKGDTSFLNSLKTWVPKRKLRVFDLSSSKSLSYDPLSTGSPLEAAQRLFSSLVWSEEYYKSKAFSALQRLFQEHYARTKRNPSIKELAFYLDDIGTYKDATQSENYDEKLAEKDFYDLSGLRDQIKTLCSGHLINILSPQEKPGIKLETAAKGTVLYFRLQSLLSPQIVTTVGKLLINHLNFLAGQAHRNDNKRKREAKLIPTYLDEFASFACPEFADLISKARSAGMALHFSHQSVGDLEGIADGFLNRITDNSATKIVLRINDPDSAEFFARSFGTKLYQKITQRITNVKEIDTAEVVGEGTQREAHQFRAPPDLLKTLPTGVGSVLIAHGFDSPGGASTVFKIKFPNLKEVK